MPPASHSDRASPHRQRIIHSRDSALIVANHERGRIGRSREASSRRGDPLPRSLTFHVPIPTTLGEAIHKPPQRGDPAVIASGNVFRFTPNAARINRRRVRVLCCSMRYLAIDLGDKRTGLALGDDLTRIVSPLEVLEVPIAANQGADLEAAIARAIGEHLGPLGELVVGLPLNMDDTEGPRAKLVRAFGERLAIRTARTVHYCDERLSSADADWSMARSGMTRGEKKRRRDALAAAAILRDFIASIGPA